MIQPAEDPEELTLSQNHLKGVKADAEDLSEAIRMLNWAAQNEATPAEMRAWGRCQRDEDLLDEQVPLSEIRL